MKSKMKLAFYPITSLKKHISFLLRKKKTSKKFESKVQRSQFSKRQRRQGGIGRSSALKK
jgi:hypothetical protein